MPYPALSPIGRFRQGVSLLRIHLTETDQSSLYQALINL